MNFFVLLKNGFIWIVTRALVVLIAVGFFSSRFVDYKKIQHGERIRGLHYLQADSFAPLADLILHGQPLSKEALNEYVFFYEKATKYMAQNAAGHSLLGFCYYQQGEWDKSVAAHQEAITINGNVFWFYHNLGLIYYQQRDFESSIAIFKQAVGKDPEVTMKFLQDAKRFYHPIIRSVQFKAEDVRGRMKNGYRDSFYVILRSMENLSQYKAMVQWSRLAIQSNVGSPWLFTYFAGRAQFSLKNYSLAYKYFAETVKLKPDFPDAYRLGMKSAQAIDKKELADQMQKKWITLEAQNENFMSREFPDLELKIF